MWDVTAVIRNEAELKPIICHRAEFSNKVWDIFVAKEHAASHYLNIVSVLKLWRARVRELSALGIAMDGPVTFAAFDAGTVACLCVIEDGKRIIKFMTDEELKQEGLKK